MDNKSVEKYFNSFKFDSDEIGQVIGEGSDRTLGDKFSDVSECEIKQSNENNESIGVRLFSKPKPRYTEMARKQNYQGTVTLKVVFLASGGIGKIEPQNRLKFGLTEQAIAAAKKLVFLPAKRKGKNINTLKKVQYRFSTY